MAHDSSPPPPLEVSAIEAATATREPDASEGPATDPWAARSRGFVLRGAAGEEIGCRDVVGFREAVLAAQDPRAATPARLAVVGPDPAASVWLERWAEDVEQVRRRLTVRRADGVEITLVATLASFGEGIAASLAVESVGPLGGGAIHRSGVHPRVEVDAMLAHYEKADAARTLLPMGETAMPPPQETAMGEAPLLPADAP